MSMDLRALIERSETFKCSPDVLRKVVSFEPQESCIDLTIKQLKTDSYPSRTRNKLIAEAFYLTGEIEKYGSVSAYS